MEIFDILYSLAAFIIAIAVLVTIHEFGHFWVARKMGVKVLRFSVGFGKPIWTRIAGIDRTEYVIARIPFGGFVKMLDEREGEVEESEKHRAFNRQSVWRRIAIVVAGPLFNFIFAILAYYLIYLAGVTGIKPVVGEVSNPSPAYTAGVQQGDQIISVNGIDTPSWEKARFTLLEESVSSERIKLVLQGSDLQLHETTIDLQGMNLLQDEQIDLIGDLGLSVWRPKIPPTIDEVLAGGAAERAGLMAEDQIVSLNGEAIEDPAQWVALIRANAGRTMTLQLSRFDRVETLQITPREQTVDGETFGYIGVRNRVDIPDEIRQQMSVTQRYGPVSALLESVDKTWRMSWLTLRVLGKLVIGEASVKNLSGPITIARYAGLSASIGIEPFLGFLAIISISLGVLNLLPVPMLDGGHLFYYLIELLTGHPVSEKIEIIGQKIGMVLLFGLMSIAIYNDLLRLVG